LARHCKPEVEGDGKQTNERRLSGPTKGLSTNVEKGTKDPFQTQTGEKMERCTPEKPLDNYAQSPG